MISHNIFKVLYHFYTSPSGQCQKKMVRKYLIGFLIIFGFFQMITGIDTTKISINSTRVIPTEHNSNSTNRNSKWFPFLAVVSFPNTRCRSSSGGDSGICYTKRQCTLKGGTDTMSSCAQGYGTCCIFTTSCTGYPGGVTVTNNLTHVTGKYSNETQQPCNIKIPKQPGVCQLRIDFTTFNIGSAGTDGVCANDTVTFSGASNLPNGLILCGMNTNQHVYLQYGDSDSISINPNLISQQSIYDFQITMIKCNSTEKAPDGCTQYFTSPRGNVSSFNFPMQQLNSEMYTVCVKSPGKMITWSTCNGIGIPFFITGDPTNNMNVSGIGDQCKTDYILIPPNNIRCGNVFNDVPSTVSPFVMYVNFDSSEMPEVPPLNPDTGCPLGFNCTASYLPCMAMDTCDAPSYMADLYDASNNGFCLMYAVS